MRFGLYSALYCLLAAAIAVIVWLYSARSFSLLVDRFYTVPMESRHPAGFRYDNGSLAFENLTMDTMTPQFTWFGEFTLSGGRAWVATGGKSFPFGPAQPFATLSGMPAFDIVADPGDAVTLTIERSLISWPVPFETNFMTGVVPSWRRHAYCRLRWAKRSGARLEMLWRTEQGYYRETRWPKMQGIAIGLIRIAITEASGLEKAAVQYLSRTKHWDPAEYRLESRGPSADGTEEIFFALHRDDRQAASPGAGRSVELRIAYRTRQVTREIGGQ